jgi:hypothetical protein
MEIEFTITEPDCFAFIDYHATHSPSVRRTYRLLRFGFGALYLAFGLFEAFVESNGVAAALWLLVAAAWIMVLPPWLRRYRRRMVLRMYREGRNPSLLGKCLYRIEPDGLAFASAVTEGKQRWAGFEKVVCTPDHAFLYVSAVGALIVPRARVVRGDYDAFVTAVRTHMASAAA